MLLPKHSFGCYCCFMRGPQMHMACLWSWMCFIRKMWVNFFYSNSPKENENLFALLADILVGRILSKYFFWYNTLVTSENEIFSQKYVQVLDLFCLIKHMIYIKIWKSDMIIYSAMTLLIENDKATHPFLLVLSVFQYRPHSQSRISKSTPTYHYTMHF